MLNKDDLKKVAKKIILTHQGRRSLEIMHPKRDWLIGVCACLLLVLATTVWSGVTYIEVRSLTEGEAVVTETEAVVYRESHVQEALRILAERAVVIESIVPNSAAAVPAASVASSTASSTGVVVEEESATTTESVDTSLLEME